MMIVRSLVAVLLAAQTPPAETPNETVQLTQQSKAAIRCSAAFAMVAYGQENGNAAAQKWPDLGTRGREFFVVALAQLMDDTGLDREGVSRLVSAEAQRLWDSGEVDQVMPACLLMLEASGV
ncbi:MAG: hypothetical protein AAGE86_09175 [Pseudomonadota bacterium]